MLRRGWLNHLFIYSQFLSWLIWKTFYILDWLLDIEYTLIYLDFDTHITKQLEKKITELLVCEPKLPGSGRQCFTPELSDQ